MVVSETTQARTRRDKAPAAEASAPPEVQDASESSQAYPCPVSQHLAKVGGLRHNGRTQELHVYHDPHHYAASIRVSEESSGGRDLRKASSLFLVRARHGLRALP